MVSSGSRSGGVGVGRPGGGRAGGKSSSVAVGVGAASSAAKAAAKQLMSSPTPYLGSASGKKNGKNSSQEHQQNQLSTDPYHIAAKAVILEKLRGLDLQAIRSELAQGQGVGGGSSKRSINNNNNNNLFTSSSPTAASGGGGVGVGVADRFNLGDETSSVANSIVDAGGRDREVSISSAEMVAVADVGGGKADENSTRGASPPPSSPTSPHTEIPGQAEISLDGVLEIQVPKGKDEVAARSNDPSASSSSSSSGGGDNGDKISSGGADNGDKSSSGGGDSSGSSSASEVGLVIPTQFNLIASGGVLLDASIPLGSVPSSIPRSRRSTANSFTL